MSKRTPELEALLRSLRLPTIAGTYANLALKAAREGLTHEQFLYELAKLEREDKDQRRTERLLHESRLPPGKTFDTLQMDRFPAPVRQLIQRLRSGSFLDKAVNVIAVGRPGAGKTHLLAALGYELVHQGHTVLFSSTAKLVQRLLRAKEELRLPQELAKLDRYACLICDDIGYVQQDRSEMEIFFTLLSERYERRSVLISTNLVFSEWERIFKDPLTTIAAIDRVVHHSVIVDLMQVESFRAEAARTAQALPAKAK
jgi:DNA replication protein DnaC